MSVEQPYLEQRLVAGEWRLGIVGDDGRWIMLRRGTGDAYVPPRVRGIGRSAALTLDRLHHERSMRIDPKDVVAGLPALTAREVVRGVIRSREVDEAAFRGVCERAGVPPRRVHATLIALCRLGYLEPLKVDKYRPMPRWSFSREGSAFAWAHATPPIRRATADRIVAELVERARQFEGWRHRYAFGVAEMLVFGSYLSDRPDLGDVDVAYALLPRYANDDRQFDAALRRVRVAERTGRRWANLVDRLWWPEIEVVRFLRARRRSLSLMNADAHRDFLAEIPTRTIYTRPAGDGSLT